MTKLLLIIFLLLGQLAFGQNQSPTKSQLLKYLLKDTRREGRFYNSTNWFTCQSNSTFQLADTLKFLNNPNYRHKIHICDFIDWNFYKKDAFWFQKVQLCEEPTTASFPNDTDFYTFKVIGDKGPLTLEIFNQGRLVYVFEVLSIGKLKYGSQTEDVTDVLTLVRINKQ